MLKIFLYLIEGFIIGYFDFKFIKKDFNYYLISFFSIIFTLSHVIAEQYLVYDYLSVVITITILYLMNGLDNKISKTMNLFISTFIGIVICMFDSMSILKIIFVLKTGSEGVWYSQDIVYYIILVVTRLMIFITLYLLDKKQIFKQLIISNKYLTLLTSISLVNCLITSFIANGIYMNSISYGYVYLLAIIFMVTIISVFIIILSINKDNMRIKKQEIELIQLKSIEEKYIAVQSQNKRNEEIKHDLEYFMSLVNKKSDCDELTKTLKNTINKINQNHIKVYSKNKIFNGLLEEIKDTANKYNQQVLYNLNVGLIEFSLQDYQSVLTLFQEICQNNETKKIDINVNVKNGFMIIEFIFKPKKEMEYEVENRYILKEKIADYESIKYVLKLYRSLGDIYEN